MVTVKNIVDLLDYKRECTDRKLEICNCEVDDCADCKWEEPVTFKTTSTLLEHFADCKVVRMNAIDFDLTRICIECNEEKENV